jgi:hypothetical protein
MRTLKSLLLALLGLIIEYQVKCQWAIIGIVIN